MEDWQGCLAPQCQTALLNARSDVDRRGGAVITVEDFLLALLDTSPSASQFLRGSGVDMDELVRTIQCEQPIVTEVGGEGLLSSQLMYWLATAREAFGTPVWLDWPQLLETLARPAERLQEKAYVAVLERVSRWPDVSDSVCYTERMSQPGIANEEAAPVVIADPEWAELAEDVVITLSAGTDALVWVRGNRGAGKSVWLRSVLSSMTLPYVEVDLRCEAELMASELAIVPVAGGKPWPVLVLDNVSPADLLCLMERPSGLASELVQRWRGPLLLLGPDGPGRDSKGCALEHRLGRTLEVFDMPLSSALQRKAILVAHQAAIERRWRIQLPQSAIQFASTRISPSVCSPGGMLQWVERAAARLHLFARRGSTGALALSGQAETLRRQSLVALARQEPLDDIEQSLSEVQLLSSAAEITWHERKAAGTLDQLTVEDLRSELERLLAARPGPVHYVQQNDQLQGESASAGSGNLHS